MAAAQIFCRLLHGRQFFLVLFRAIDRAYEKAEISSGKPMAEGETYAAQSDEETRVLRALACGTTLALPWVVNIDRFRPRGRNRV